MSANIPSLYAQQYATNIQLLLQQKDSRLKNFSNQGSHVGEQASPVDQIEKIEMQAAGARFAPIGRVDAGVDRRWVLPNNYDLNQLLDSFDELRLLTDPKSSYVANAVAAANRQIDREIINAFFDDAKTGKTGSSTTSFLSANQIAATMGAASATGLNVKKLREAKKILMSYNVDLESEQIFCAVTAKQHDDLLAEAQVVSTDFNDKPVLVEGKVMRFMGINFIHTELLETDGSSYRRLPVWVKSGIHLGQWGSIYTDVDQRKDLVAHPWQAYMKMTIGATRLDEEKVIEIKCAE
jgi:hypothetical protein